jgi:hypothetical protein
VSLQVVVVVISSKQQQQKPKVVQQSRAAFLSHCFCTFKSSSILDRLVRVFYWLLRNFWMSWMLPRRESKCSILRRFWWLAQN